MAGRKAVVVSGGGNGSGSGQGLVVFTFVFGISRPVAINDVTNYVEPEQTLRLTNWRITAVYAPSGIGKTIIDIKRNGTSILQASDASKIILNGGSDNNQGTNFLTNPVDLAIGDKIQGKVINITGTYPGALIAVQVTARPI